MIRSLFARSATLIPQAALGHLGWARGAVGAALGIGLTAAISAVLVGTQGMTLPMIVAPVGASAVLVFGLPASPLAQPWAVIGGNLVSAVAGLAMGMLFQSPIVAGALAVGLAIAGMSMARCLHPPGGGTALLYALGATGPDQWGWLFLVPVLCNVLALGAAGWLYNNATGHTWPHHVDVPAPRPAQAARLASREEVEAVLEDWDEVLDIDVDDLHALVQAVERRRVKDDGLPS